MISRYPFKVVIPARYASSRLPGKPLLQLAGKSMIQHVYERALESGAEQIIIATDDERIKEETVGFGGEVCMTSDEHHTGTDRIAEVIDQLDWDANTIIVNLQGDEPLMDPELIRQVAEDLGQHKQAAITTLCCPIHTTADLFDPHVVKVVMDAQNYALYFSRASIPWDRDAFTVTTEELPENSEHYRHIGLYAYRASFLRKYSSLKPCYLEQTESLEQLRALYNGAKIHVSVTGQLPGHGVDTEEDLNRVVTQLKSLPVGKS